MEPNKRDPFFPLRYILHLDIYTFSPQDCGFSSGKEHDVLVFTPAGLGDPVIGFRYKPLRKGCAKQKLQASSTFRKATHIAGSSLYPFPMPHQIQVACNRNRGLPDWQWHRHGRFALSCWGSSGNTSCLGACPASPAMDVCPTALHCNLAGSRSPLWAPEHRSSIRVAHFLIILSTRLEDSKPREEPILLPSLVLPTPSSYVSGSLP